MEFTFAILIIILGMTASERFQTNQEEQQLAKENKTSLVVIEANLENQDLS